MKRAIAITIILLTCCIPTWSRNERDTLGTGTMVHFVENLGQWDSKVIYEVQLHDAAVFLEQSGITVALREHLPHPHTSGEWKMERKEPGVRGHAYKMHFIGASPTLPLGYDRRNGYSNYYLGNDPSHWRSNVGSYASVRYQEIYPGVTLELYGGSNALKYNFIVSPGANPSAIVLQYEGVKGISVSREGNLIVKTSVRDVVELKPYVFQEEKGEKSEIKSRWRVEKDNESWRVWIELDNYNPSRELVIDPVLIFSTYTGSIADNWGTTAAYDSEKNVYTAGLVFNVGYPTTTGAYQLTFGGNCDVGIFKFDSLGTQRLYATYLGGSMADMPHSLFVNSFDDLVIFGSTGSTNFPVTAGAFQTSHAGGDTLSYEDPYNYRTVFFPQGSDIFVSRLSADGSQLQASTYVGGTGNDGLNYHRHFNRSESIIMCGNDSLYYNYGDGARGEIITDNLNNIYVGSTTMSNDFPTTAASLQPSHQGRQDGVVFKLDHNLRTLLWSTYLGGSMDDAVYSIDVDSAYNLLVCGGTNSPNFPTTDSAWQTSYGGGSADGFVSKISYNGDRLMASTFVGEQFYDQLYFVRTGRHDEIFLFGQTQPMNGSSFIYNAGYSVYNSGMLLMRMLPDLSGRVWSTLFGTPGRINLSPTAFAADICNRIYLAGWGRDFVGHLNHSGTRTQFYTAGTWGMETSSDAWSDSTDGQDFYLMSIDADANTLEYASFFGQLHSSSGYGYNGADHVDGGTSRFDRLATLYQSVCASCGGSQGFPTTADAWSDSNRSSNCNNALFRFNVTNDFPVAEFLSPSAGCAPYTLTFHNTGRGTSYLWNFGDGTSSSECNPSHTYTSGGIYTVTLIAYMAGGCADADTQRHSIHVIGNDSHSFAPLIACHNDHIQIGLQPQLGATYQWLSGQVSDPSVANPWVSDSGIYILRVSAPGCSETDTFKVKTYTLIDLWHSSAISCHDSTDGSAFFHISSSLDPDSVTLTLLGPHGSSLPYSLSNHTCTFSHLPPGSYHLAANGYGCSFELDFTLDNPPRPYYEKESSPLLCSDSCSGWIKIRYNFSGVPETSFKDTLISGLCEGTYITHLLSLGCPLIDTTTLIRNHDLDNFHAWTDQSHFYLGASIELHSTEIDGASYHWAPSGDLENPSAPNTLATPSDTSVCYHVQVTSPQGCKASDTLCLKGSIIHCGTPDYFIPNAFTPNGDGINDFVDFSSPLLSEIHIALFNRWGQCVFQSDNLNDCRWDGTYQNNRCLPGVYTYTCRIRCHNGQETELKGDITLIR